MTTSGVRKQLHSGGRWLAGRPWRGDRCRKPGWDATGCPWQSWRDSRTSQGRHRRLSR